MSFQKKYLKYKNKYLNLKNHLGGALNQVINTDNELINDWIHVKLNSSSPTNEDLTQFLNENANLTRGQVINYLNESNLNGNNLNESNFDFSDFNFSNSNSNSNNVESDNGLINNWIPTLVNSNAPTENELTNFLNKNKQLSREQVVNYLNKHNMNGNNLHHNIFRAKFETIEQYYRYPTPNINSGPTRSFHTYAIYGSNIVSYDDSTLINDWVRKMDENITNQNLIDFLSKNKQLERNTVIDYLRSINIKTNNL
jgi:hypothetical protein